ncbi:MAG: PocR ligand-binding domain-containing protein [Bacillota bacterium]|nr:PocR ligand-binding domain-containing protein [Bacillota bacterium]
MPQLNNRLLYNGMEAGDYLAMMLEKDSIRAWDMQKASRAADNYSKACEVSCRVIDSMGTTLYLATDPNHVGICDLAASVLPGARSREQADRSHVCDNAHLYGCYQAERFGGRYIYFCPLGLTHWVSPIYQNGVVVGSLLCGPVNMVDPDEFLIEDLVARNGIHPDYLAELRNQINQVPVVSTERVNAMSELLYLVAAGLSDASFSETEYRKGSDDLQAKLWEQISFIKRFTHKNEEDLAYPIEKETQLLEWIEVGDKAASQKILNEILGHIFFSSSGSIEIMRARVIELVVLLSRAAIRGGADVEQIFGLNYTYLNKINTFRNIDEIAYWLSGIMARFTDQVFNLTNVKHADVIFRAIDYVKKNYMKKITLEETASYVFLSPAYFSRVFKEEIGDNFNTYVNTVRVDAAMKLLLNETIALVDISSMVGFETQSYFSKVFKRVTGVTPGKFRESRGKIKPGR